MDQEPVWVQAGYAHNGYEAKCRICGETALLRFDKEDRVRLTIKYRDEVNQDELFAYMYFFVVEKLRRACDCSEEERQSYERTERFI